MRSCTQDQNPRSYSSSNKTKIYSCPTEKASVNWIKLFILSHIKRHPKTLSGPEIEKFFSNLPTERDVSSSTHTVPMSFWDNQPLSTLHFIYQEVLGVELDSPFVSVCLNRNKGFGKAWRSTFHPGTEIQSSRARLITPRLRVRTLNKGA